MCPQQNQIKGAMGTARPPPRTKPKQGGYGDSMSPARGLWGTARPPQKLENNF